MKRVYEQPNMEVECFAANEYIASCYAIVDVNNAANFVIKGNWDGVYTDGKNTNQGKQYYFDSKGFSDDNLDYLDQVWFESHDGLFYNGPGMTHTTAIQTWEGAGEAKGQRKMDYMATQVSLQQITEGNAATYNTTVNAS